MVLDYAALFWFSQLTDLSFIIDDKGEFALDFSDSFTVLISSDCLIILPNYRHFRDKAVFDYYVASFIKNMKNNHFSFINLISYILARSWKLIIIDYRIMYLKNNVTSNDRIFN